ncbi:MAG: DNA repair protein RecO [Candidatus Omnitrophica bacterium]|nr:DNA repair protein RecO [Candidatus Omnitrophota bacterium]
MIVRTEGVVLKSYDFRETSRIVHFYTKDHGKVKGVLKGIRANPRKFGSHADQYSVNDIVYYRYSRSDLHLVSQCDLKSFFFSVRQDYRRSLAANYMLELINSIMPVEQKNEEIYSLALHFLNSLQDISDIDKLVHVLQIKTLSLSGFRPHIDACVRCGKKVAGKVRFSMRAGGLICYECPTNETNFSIISSGIISSILFIEQKNWEQCLRLGLTPSMKKELKFLLNNFLVYHLEKRIKTAKYM